MKTKALILAIVVGMFAGAASADYINWPVKWSQIPWDPNGSDWLSDCTVGTVMADDFECNDPDKIYAVRWWGSYPTGTTHLPGPFHISFHTSVGPHPSSMPGPLAGGYTVTPQETQVGMDNFGVPVFRYDAYLLDADGAPDPFDQYSWSQHSANQNPGELFIDICKPSGENWGWHEVVPPHPILDFAAVGATHAGPWTSTPTDMAFELMTIPEPATLALLALGGVGILIRRRRRHNHKV